MAGRKRIGIKILRKILSESVFNPDEQNALSIVLDIGNPTYCETRAIELIRESQILIERLYFYSSNKEQRAEDYIIDPIDDIMFHYNEKMKQAISLLAMAKAIRIYESSTKKNK